MTAIDVGLDATIRAEGQPLGRFIWVSPPANKSGKPRVADGDWLPEPLGTHDGYIWRGGFYCLKVTAEQVALDVLTLMGARP